jgi:hypothetical protein
MRVFFVSVCLVSAAPAAAQTAVEQAHDMITAQNIEAGFAPAVAEGLATCFTGIMSEDEAEVILASEPGAPQQIAARMMQHYDDAVACSASVIQ